MQDRPTHAFHGLLSSVSGQGVFGFALSALPQSITDHPQCGLPTVTLPAGRAGFPHGIPAWFVLDVVVPAADDKMRLAPDDLAADLKPTRFETLCHDDRLCAGVPHVRDRSLKQYPGFAPVRPIIILDDSR